MEELPEELLVMICGYALRLAQGLWLTCEPPSEDEKRKVRYHQWCQKRFALGLLFTNRRISRIAIPIVYGENTICFMAVKTAVGFLERVPRTSLERIKKIYFPDSVEPSAASRMDDSLISSATTLLQQMSLDTISIKVPHYKSMQGETYGLTIHGGLSRLVCLMLQDGRLNTVQFVMRGRNRHHSWNGQTSVFGEEIIKNYVECRLFDERTRINLQLLRKPYAKWKGGNPPRSYNRSQVKRGRAEYRNMLKSVRSKWESEGVTVKGRTTHLKTRRSLIEIRRLKTRTKQGSAQANR